MSLNKQIEQLERLSAKVWRKHIKEDPLSMLSFNEYDYLKVVQASPEPIRLTDLAQEMEVSKPSATNMVQRLERKALVKRIACEQDARAKRVVLTDLARTHLSLEDVVYQNIASDLSTYLDDQERLTLETLLAKALRGA